MPLGSSTAIQLSVGVETICVAQSVVASPSMQRLMAKSGEKVELLLVSMRLAAV